MYLHVNWEQMREEKQIWSEFDQSASAWEERWELDF